MTVHVAHDLEVVQMLAASPYESLEITFCGRTSIPKHDMVECLPDGTVCIGGT